MGTVDRGQIILWQKTQEGHNSSNTSLEQSSEVFNSINEYDPSFRKEQDWAKATRLIG